MPEETPPNVKIYARPERKAPSPVLLVIALILALVVGFFLYKAFFHRTPATNTPTGIIRVSDNLWQEKVLR